MSLVHLPCSEVSKSEWQLLYLCVRHCSELHCIALFCIALQCIACGSVACTLWEPVFTTWFTWRKLSCIFWYVRRYKYHYANMYKIKIKMQMYTLYSACSLWEPVFQLEERRVGLKEAVLGHFSNLGPVHFSLRLILSQEVLCSNMSNWVKPQNFQNFSLSLASSHHTLLISGPHIKDNVILHCFEIFTSHVGLTGREKAENQI